MNEFTLLTTHEDRNVRFTEERRKHIETTHPEMAGQIPKIEESLASPDMVVRSRTDPLVELWYRLYPTTPVTRKYMCVAVKAVPGDSFIITAYFTDVIKKGDILWKKK